jgi:hypothetical protein
MRYSEVEQAVRDLVAAADGERRRRFGAATVVRLTSDGELAAAAEAEFDEDARQAFAEACADPANSTADRLLAWLDRIDEGTTSDGDMDPQVLLAVEALDHWARYLAEGDPDFLAELAVRSLEEVDYQVPADLDDFLGTPEMAAEFARISALLKDTAATG